MKKVFTQTDEEALVKQISGFLEENLGEYDGFEKTVIVEILKD